MTPKDKAEIEQFKPCEDALVFRKKYETFEQAWAECPRGDWMLWIAQKLEVDLRVLTLAKGHCAATVLHLMKDERSRKAVEVAISYGEGNATDDELSAASDAASYAAYYAASDAATASYAAYYAAASAATAASAASDAASDAATAAYAASDAASDAATAAYAASDAAHVRITNQKATADICRKYLTEAVMEKIKAL